MAGNTQHRWNGWMHPCGWSRFCCLTICKPSNGLSQMGPSIALPSSFPEKISWVLDLQTSRATWMDQRLWDFGYFSNWVGRTSVLSMVLFQEQMWLHPWLKKWNMKASNNCLLFLNQVWTFPVSHQTCFPHWCFFLLFFQIVLTLLWKLELMFGFINETCIDTQEAPQNGFYSEIFLCKLFQCSFNYHTFPPPWQIFLFV